ncbi:MAG: GPW/gp25 family protein [Chitinophagaceae bacterium]|nr:GPW/gp25 family protein [Chitinophagaceae bacterium]
MADYLKLPLRFERFFEKQKLPVCTLNDSISRNVHLLITTATEENKLDERYGSQFWDNDYDIHLSNDGRRELVMESLQQQITLYEKRLVNVVVKVTVKQTTMNDKLRSQLRRRIEIIVSGNIARSNEPYEFQTGFFIGPMAFD